MKLTREQIGGIGENLAKSFFEWRGSEVVLSEDQYDTTKDMVVDGKTTEIKTQTIYRQFPCENGTKQPAFTVPISNKNLRQVFTNQLNKCLTVERLVFVSRPGIDNKIIRFYEAPEPGKRTFQIEVNKRDNRIVAGFPISNLQEIGECMDKNIIKELMDDWKSY
jgi:hypothetical protein